MSRYRTIICGAVLSWILGTVHAESALVANVPPATVLDRGVWAFSVTAPNGQQSTLMGTLHVADRHLLQPDPRVVRTARVIVLEHPGLGTGPVASTPWRQALSLVDIETLRLHFSCRLPLAAPTLVKNVVDTLLAQPTPVAATQLAYEGCDSVGYEPRDVIIKQAQVRYQIPLSYLETDAAVVALEKLVPSDTSGRGVHFALSNDAAILKADIVDALNSGDYDRVEAASAVSWKAAGIAYAPMYDLMVRRRNENWMRTLPSLLDAGGAFVLVGAGHLPGRHGLVTLLRSHGYIVRPVQLPAGEGTTAETYRVGIN